MSKLNSNDFVEIIPSDKIDSNAKLDIIKASYHGARLASEAYVYASLLLNKTAADTIPVEDLARALSYFSSGENLFANSLGVITKCITDYPVASTYGLIGYVIINESQGFKNSKKYIKKLIFGTDTHDNLSLIELNEANSGEKTSKYPKIKENFIEETQSGWTNKPQVESYNIEKKNELNEITNIISKHEADTEKLIEEFHVIDLPNDAENVTVDTNTNYRPITKALICGGYLLAAPTLIKIGGPMLPIVYFLSSDTLSEGMEKVVSKIYNKFSNTNKNDSYNNELNIGINEEGNRENNEGSTEVANLGESLHDFVKKKMSA